MNVAGIIAEYNPMHNGHINHINLCKKSTKADAVVAVLSGNFVQRGTPAILDKWTRTKMALGNGVDLVLELPVIYSISSADFFARGAVGILNSIGVVSSLCFGSEYPDIDSIMKISGILSEEPLLYKEKLKYYLASGMDFPTARNFAIKEISPAGLSCYLEKPNSILGIEYCKSLIRSNSSISPYAVKREGGGHDDTTLDNNFSSASSIRKYLKSGNGIEELKFHVPANVFEELSYLKNKGCNLLDYNDMMPFIKYKYYTNKNTIKNLPDVSEGIENRIFNAIQNTADFEELVSLVKTKRYTYSRICRIITQFFIGFDFYDTLNLRKKDPPYARILGFNEKGKQILKSAKKSSSIPLITKVKTNQFDILDLEIQATNAYSLLNKNVKFNEDFYTGPVII
jgi:predicted nucleotidyltransferase